MSKLTFDQHHRYYETRIGRSLQARDKVPVCCPFHDDHDPSATAFLDSGGFHCNGCGAKGSIVDFEMAFTKCDRLTALKNISEITRASINGSGKRLVSTHIYRDREGMPICKKERYELPDGRKIYGWFHRDSAGRWQFNLREDTPRLLYNLPNIITATLILFVEGEKCADLLNGLIPKLWRERQKNGLRIAVTTNPEGAWGPNQKPKWREEYNKSFSNKSTVIFDDNDPSGRTLADHVSAQIYCYADSVRRIGFADKPEKYDIADWIEEHSADEKLMIAELERMIESAPVWKPNQQDQAAEDRPWSAEDMHAFLSATDGEVAWLEQDILAPETLTQMFSPRGLGKTLFAEHCAVTLASAGKRVLILDRDNPRHTLRSRLRSLGADELCEKKANLKVISREKCPPLTRPVEWAAFPYADYDVVIVDSLDAMAEGVGEQDSAKPARAMAPLLDICHRENGPAVLLLGNTIKSAEHSRGSGVIEDRADIVYEVRDATDFRPSGTKPWVEELPAQGAGEWAARSSRRKGRTVFRLALIASKFRLGEEPAPRVVEIDMRDEPWTVRDVTTQIDEEGEEARAEKARTKAERHLHGVDLLRQEVQRRVQVSESPIRKKDAEGFLVAAKFKQKEARAIIADSIFLKAPIPGQGHPVELHLKGVKDNSSTEIDRLAKPSVYTGSETHDFGGLHGEHTTEIDPTETRRDSDDFHSGNSVTGTTFGSQLDDDSAADEELRI